MRILLVAGGDVDSNQLREIYTNDLYVIGVDRGGLYLLSNGIIPDRLIGDYDSVNEEEKDQIFDSFRTSGHSDKDIEILNSIKDDTDTEHALLYAISMKPSQIILMGCTGSRLDQTFSSMRMLKRAYDAGVEAYIIDKHNRIRIAKGETIIRKEDSFGKYISVLPYGVSADGLTEKGFKYEVEEETLFSDNSQGVSNELTDEVGVISCNDYIFIMESID